MAVVRADSFTPGCLSRTPSPRLAPCSGKGAGLGHPAPFFASVLTTHQGQYTGIPVMTGTRATSGGEHAAFGPITYLSHKESNQGTSKNGAANVNFGV